MQGQGERRPLQPPSVELLEPDQRRMLEVLGTGATLAETAAELSYSSRTVSRRLAAARQFLGVATTTEALAQLLLGGLGPGAS